MNTAALALSLLLTTKTPYAPQQASTSYEAPPAGYKAVYTQMLARHGSRGLSSSKTDLALYNLWQLAAREDALTPLGRKLGPDIEQMMQANALLGYGVAGISKPGYGNETMQGITEHTQLAERLRARLPELFRDLASASANAGANTGADGARAGRGAAADKARRIVIVTSGKDRAVDSGYFFGRSLVQQQPALAPLVDAGVDRFTLYFHKLNAKDDTLVTESSLAYQRWVKSDELQARETAIHAQPQLHAAAQATLARVFTPAFIEALNAGQRSAANTGARSYTSADGKFTNTLAGDGKTVIANATDAALALYELYAAAADMQAELTADFSQYMPPEQAIAYAEAEDAVAFYEKGPGIAENGDVTWRMAAPLLDDFFKETDAIAAGDLSHAAKLRFAHAEIVIPLASAFGLPGMSTQLPRSATYSYQSSTWRGALVAPMAANIQWDVYQNAAGRTLVRLLYNEQEADFKPACKHAKVAPSSHFYDYKQLKRCYK